MPDGFNIDYSLMIDPEVRKRDFEAGLHEFVKSIPGDTPPALRDVYISLAMGPKGSPIAKKMQADAVEPLRRANALAKASRGWMQRQGGGRVLGTRLRPSEVADEVLKSFGENDPFLKSYPEGTNPFLKANLDVGTLTNFAQITGGQSLGYVSLDTQMARGTIRPNSFTLYQCLPKSAAFQVVDYWAYASNTGGGLPGTAFTGFANVSSGTLQTSAGVYQLNNITLKLAVNGRSITTALAAQNSFVDVAAQENINAALTILESLNWTNYYGDSTVYANQPNGLTATIPSGNVFDFQAFSTNNAAQGWSQSQALFNMIYETASSIASYTDFGRVTHAFMTPVTMGSLQSLVTTLLNNIQNNLTSTQVQNAGIWVDGDLQGIRTRVGEIQFPMDISISARYKPAQAIIVNEQTGANGATLTNPTRPQAVTATALAASGVPVSDWTAAYVASSGTYSFAVASTDAASNESTLTYLLGVSGIAVNGAYQLTIQPPSDTSASAFRIYRSGLAYNPASSGVANPASFRYIGTVVANGSSNVTFTDTNARIPGSEDIFLLDLSDEDNALDYRFLLPLTKINLFAQNLFMPWAVAMIGSIRNRVPKFHGIIRNYVPDTVNFSPLMPNANAN